MHKQGLQCPVKLSLKGQDGTAKILFYTEEPHDIIYFACLNAYSIFGMTHR